MSDLVTEKEVRAHVAERIRVHIKKHGWSVEQLADFADVHPSGVWAVLARTRLPSLRWLVKVANACGCAPSNFLP